MSEEHHGEAQLEFFDLPGGDEPHHYVHVTITSDPDNGGANLTLTSRDVFLKVDLSRANLERTRDFMTFLLAMRP
jgi:hypothetical protein